VKVMQDVCRMIDALGICKFVYLFGGVPLRKIAQLYSAVTGWETTLEDLIKAGERIWMLQRLFNVRMGVSRKDDTLPRRFLEELMVDGAAKGQTVDLEPMLEEYYVERGLDREGRPMKKKLLELNLDSAIKYVDW
ncbi:MAG: aldehyde ferredoxin oxidoreductase C-terminal domain-containing protein, partial [Candidatus Bathyarchaeota archaeon]|nr:aldehyde ferredoxin oxidoreductase C-terminal domain-containing protein [Candidatus Bathyarchaeota archaeon]